MKLPSLYKPTCPEEFIGDAANVARELQRAVRAALDHDCAPVKVLFNGEPGIGKSALALYLQSLLGCHPKWSTKKYNGTQVKLETLEDIARDLQFRDMFGAYRMIWIDEADAIPSAAQIRFLTLLDDLPNSCAVVCTSNCKLEDFAKRFQTRFKIYEIEPPKSHEVAGLLRLWPLRESDISQISTFACGNVRAALLDAERALQAAA
jgi:DNA polymerase III delta prime subunit